MTIDTGVIVAEAQETMDKIKGGLKKLSDSQIFEIGMVWAEGNISISGLAEKYKVPVECIQHLMSVVDWKDVIAGWKVEADEKLEDWEQEESDANTTKEDLKMKTRFQRIRFFARGRKCQE